MAGFTLNAFAGAIPGVAARLLGDQEAQEAVNCDVRDGDIVPFGGLTDVVTLAKNGTVETVWRWADQAWFHWLDDVDVIDGAVPDDTEARTYFTGDGAPKMTYAGIATSSGDGVYPSNAYDLGVPAPGNAPNVAISGSANDPNDTGEDRTYVYTYVSAKGEEGPPSNPSASITWKPGQTVDLSSLEAGPGGNRNIATKRIYRTASGADTTAFQFVDEINVATLTYNDAVATTSLGEVLPSTTWDPPPSDMVGITGMPNGIAVGFRNNELCFCEAYLPHAWPVGYRLQTEPDIVAVAAFGNSLVVGTTERPYIVTGTDPSAMAMQGFEIPFPCVSKRGMLDMGYSVIYPSSDGLVRFDSQGPRLITRSLLTPAQWRAYVPSSIHAYRMDDFYVGFYDTGSTTGALVVPQSGDWLVELDVHGSAGYTRPADGTLYVVQNGDELKSFNTGAALTARWRSAVWQFGGPLNLGYARVTADAYPVTFRLYGDGTLRTSISVSGDQPFALPGGYRAQRYFVEIEGAVRVSRVEVAESARELRGQ